MVEMSESEQLKVTAPKFFHPTASSLFRKVVFLNCDTVLRGRVGGRDWDEDRTH